MMKVFEWLSWHEVRRNKKTTDCSDADLDKSLFEVKQNNRNRENQSSIHEPHVVLLANFHFWNVLINIQSTNGGSNFGIAEIVTIFLNNSLGEEWVETYIDRQ